MAHWRGTTKRMWVWMREPRISWTDIGTVALIWVASTVVQYFTGWNETLAVLVTSAGFAAAALTVAFCHGAWEAIRHG